MKNRSLVLSLLEALPMAVAAEHEEVLAFVAHHNLKGKGLGYVDVHLLASAVLSRLSLWTLDGKLQKAADMLHVRYRGGRA